MERYWALRWIRQEGLERLSATVLKGDVLRIDGMPFITRLPGLPELPRGQRLELDVVATHLIDLTLEARVRHVLAAQSAVDEDDEALAGDDGENGTPAGPLESAAPVPPSAVPPAA
jgi:exoribonuclease-2